MTQYYVQRIYIIDSKRCREKLRAPDNGAIACDYWLGGSFCHMFCQQKYDVPIGVGIAVNGMFICGQTGKWSPSATVPNCASLYLHFFRFANISPVLFFFYYAKLHCIRYQQCS